MSIASPARVRLLVCLLLAAALSAVVAVCWAPPGAAAPAALRPGVGYRLPGGDYAGSYVTRSGVTVYCIDPGKRAPSTVSLTSVNRYAGMTQRTADELAYALTTWGNARTRAQAAAESQLVNTIVGHTDAVRRRARSLPRSITTTVAAHLRTVRTRRGPYTVQVRASRVAAPGQSAGGTVTVTSGTRTGVPGVAVRLRGSGNVTVPAAVRTATRGSVGFRYTVTGPGPVRITADAAGLAATRFTGSHPAAGQQRMVTWSRTVGASAQTGFQAALGAFSHSYACSTTCNGHPPVTLHACALPSTYVARLVYRIGARTQVVDVAPGSRARCASVTLVLADRDRVTASWTFRGPHGWTAPVPAAGTFVVDCPAVPAVQVSMVFDCTQGSLAAAVADPAGHRVVLVVAGAVSRRVEVGAGATARFTAALRCGTVQSYLVQAGVRKADGTWNYGPAARLTTPGAARQP